jgi:FkbM family methyltransferase
MLIKKLLPVQLKDTIKTKLKRFINLTEHCEISTSHCGEDRILQYLFKFKKKGFFVDIGAFDPEISSNTFLFSSRGWKGINIDAYPGSMKKFQARRPQDINLEIGVGPKQENAIYYKIGDKHHQMNGFSSSFQNNLLDDFGIDPATIEKIPMEIKPLNEVLQTYLPKDQVIDFISIDVEGFELQVLESNDWATYRPIVLMIENHKPLDDLQEHTNLMDFLKSNGYRFVFKTPNELIFLEKSAKLNNSANIIFN